MFTVEENKSNKEETTQINTNRVKAILDRSILNNDVFEVLLDGELVWLTEGVTYGKNTLEQMSEDEDFLPEYFQFIQLQDDADALYLNSLGADVIVNSGYGSWWLRDCCGQAWLMDFGIND